MTDQSDSTKGTIEDGREKREVGSPERTSGETDFAESVLLVETFGAERGDGADVGVDAKTAAAGEGAGRGREFTELENVFRAFSKSISSE
jgi:hypothetical protein